MPGSGVWCDSNDYARAVAGVRAIEREHGLKGAELVDLLMVMVGWGDKWLAGEAGPPVLYRQLGPPGPPRVGVDADDGWCADSVWEYPPGPRRRYAEPRPRRTLHPNAARSGRRREDGNSDDDRRRTRGRFSPVTGILGVAAACREHDTGRTSGPLT